MPEGLVRPLQYLVDVCRAARPHLTDVIGIPHIRMRAIPHETAEGIPHSVVAQGALPRIGGTHSCNDVHCRTPHKSASHVGRLLTAFPSLLLARSGAARLGCATRLWWDGVSSTDERGPLVGRCR